MDVPPQCWPESATQKAASCVSTVCGGTQDLVGCVEEKCCSCAPGCNKYCHETLLHGVYDCFNICCAPK